MYPGRRCVVDHTHRFASAASHRTPRYIQIRGRVVAQLVEREKSLAVPLPASAGRRHRGLSNLQVASSILAGSSDSVSGAHGRGRAPPGPVAQQRTTERGVAARIPMPDEGRNVWGDDVETRVRFPPARAASSTSTTWARPLATSLPALYPSVSGRRSRVIWFSGFDSRLVHVADCFTVSSGSPHLGYPTLGSHGSLAQAPGPRGTSSSARAPATTRRAGRRHWVLDSHSNVRKDTQWPTLIRASRGSRGTIAAPHTRPQEAEPCSISRSTSRLASGISRRRRPNRFPVRRRSPTPPAATPGRSITGRDSIASSCLAPRAERSTSASAS